MHNIKELITNNDYKGRSSIMADEREDFQVETPEGKESRKKRGNKKLIIIIVAASIASAIDIPFIYQGF